MEQHAETIPGFTMQSELFYLKFITGMQGGVSSKLLEFETDWYEVMEILLSRLQDEPEHKDQFEIIASRDLEYWARIQPGGDTLNLKIIVQLEEKRYFLPPSGSRKTLRLIFNDRFSTQVVFHARKKVLMNSLRNLASIAVADQFTKSEDIETLHSEIPKTLLPDVKRSFNNCWTPRHFRSRVETCSWSCICKDWRKLPAGMLDAGVKKSTRRRLYKQGQVQQPNRRSQQNKSFTQKDLKASGRKKVEKKEPLRKAKINELSKRTLDSKRPAAKAPKISSSKTSSRQTNGKKNPKEQKSRSKLDTKSLKAIGKKKGESIKELKEKVKIMKKDLKNMMESVNKVERYSGNKNKSAVKKTVSAGRASKNTRLVKKMANTELPTRKSARISQSSSKSSSSSRTSKRRK